MHILVHMLAQLILRLVSSLEQAFLHLTQPSRYSLVVATAADLTRSKTELITENALLRQQLIILHRKSKSQPLPNPTASGSSSLPVS